LPATSCASRLSLRSDKIALTRAIAPPSDGDEAGFAGSEPVDAAGSAGCCRDASDGEAIGTD
jgi:hypothetical protein